MKRLQENLKSLLPAGMALVLIGMLGCATQNLEKKALTTHETLVASGFTYEVSKSPEQRSQFSKMPQRKLLRHVRADKTVYYYADVKNCNCVFVGDEAAIKRYGKLKRDAKSDAKNKQAFEGEEEGVFSAGEDPTSVIEDIDEGVAPGF